MKDILHLTLCATLALLLVSCEKADFGSNESDGTTNTGSLMIRTVTSESGEDENTDYVSYPVSVYVMNNKGKCVNLQQITSADDELKIELSAGTYDIYAMAGTDNYKLPAKSEATKDFIVKAERNKEQGDLMTASGNIVMEKGEENKLTLQLQRRVMQVQSITLNNIPDDVTGVQLTISPIYDGVMLGGDYSDGTTAHTFSLSEQADGSTWKNSTDGYIFGAQSNVTLKVSLIRTSGTTSYSYVSGETLAANHKVNITGSFVDDEYIVLSGTIKGTSWESTVNMAFEFKSSGGSTSGEDTSDEDETPAGNAPQTGTMYNGCYVLRTVTSGNTTTVTLITPTEIGGLEYGTSEDETKRQNKIKSSVEDALDEVAVKGITGWRLPTQEEVEYISANAERINEQIVLTGDETLANFPLDNGAYDCGYFFTADDGNIYVMELKDCEINKKPNSKRQSYKVRGFVTMNFTE